MPLSALTQQELREGDRLRLVSIKVGVISDEQITKAREKAGPDLPVRAQIEFELEPLSYRRSDDSNEKGYVTVTKGGDKGLTINEITAIRRDGWLGIPKEKQLSLPRGLTGRKLETLSVPYQRFMYFAAKAGIELMVQGVDPGVPGTVVNGQLWTPAIGQVISCRYGMDDFPMNNEGDTYTRWMWYFDKLDPDFVALPKDQREVRTVTVRDTAEGTAATTAKGQTTPADLRGAVVAIGLVGASAELSSEQQMKLISRAINDGVYEFAHPDLMEAADRGTLISVLADRGALTVVDGKVA